MPEVRRCELEAEQLRRRGDDEIRDTGPRVAPTKAAPKLSGEARDRLVHGDPVSSRLEEPCSAGFRIGSAEHLHARPPRGGRASVKPVRKSTAPAIAAQDIDRTVVSRRRSRAAAALELASSCRIGPTHLLDASAALGRPSRRTCGRELRPGTLRTALARRRLTCPAPITGLADQMRCRRARRRRAVQDCLGLVEAGCVPRCRSNHARQRLTASSPRGTTCGRRHGRSRPAARGRSPRSRAPCRIDGLPPSPRS